MGLNNCVVATVVEEARHPNSFHIDKYRTHIDNGLNDLPANQTWYPSRKISALYGLNPPAWVIHAVCKLSVTGTVLQVYMPHTRVRHEDKSNRLLIANHDITRNKEQCLWKCISPLDTVHSSCSLANNPPAQIECLVPRTLTKI